MAEKQLILHNLMCVQDALKQAQDACEGYVNYANAEGINVSREFMETYFQPDEIEHTPIYDGNYEELLAYYGSAKFYAYAERV